MIAMQNNAIPGLTVAETSDFLLAETGLTNIRYTILAGTIGLVNQAFIMGSCSQLLFKYFKRHSHDPALARIGVLWMAAMVFLQSIVTNTIQGRLTLMSAQFTSGFMMDYWLNQLSSLIVAVVFFPVLMFFGFRAWNLWSRRRLVLALCVTALIPTTFVGIAAAAIGLQHPFPLDLMSNEDFSAWLPFFMKTTRNANITSISASALQFITSSIFGSLITAGLFFHRECCGFMPGLQSKITFVTGESLIPMILTSMGLLIGNVLSLTYNHPAGGLLTRALRYAAPAIYFHCLLTSLCSPQRHRDNLRDEMENMVEDGGDYNEKGLMELRGSTFDPAFHPDDLDTPLQIDIKTPFTPPLVKKPKTTGGGGGGASSGSYISKYVGNPKLSPSPLLNIQRPSFSFSNSFLTTAMGGGKASTKEVLPYTGNYKHVPENTGGGHDELSNLTTRRGSGDKEMKDQSAFDKHIQSKGFGRRSSLAVAAAASESKQMLPISIKLHKKGNARKGSSGGSNSNSATGGLGIPVISYRPSLGKRDSENIFVAHEEFDNLPNMPGDDLGSIEEVNSNDGGTPKFYTPVIGGPQETMSPTMTRPKLPEGQPFPQGDAEHWNDIGTAR